MSPVRVTVPDAHRGLLDTTESGAPWLRKLARRFLEAGVRHFGVLLDLASVLACRAGGEPEVHVTGAADGLVRHLAAQPDALAEEGGLMALAYAGALAMVTRAEIEEAGQHGL